MKSKHGKMDGHFEGVQPETPEKKGAFVFGLVSYNEPWVGLGGMM